MELNLQSPCIDVSCRYCHKISKNAAARRQHEHRCRKNPNLILNKNGQYEIDPSDIVDKKFGMLTVISLDRIEERSGKTRPRRYFYKCKCDCGNDKILVRTNIITNHIRSCGCQRKQHGVNSKYWKGCGALSKRKWTSIMRHAVERNLEFSININYGWNLLVEQKHLCALTGIPITIDKYASNGPDASLDRIDSKQGYVIGNVQWVHKDVNKIKMNLSQQEFIRWCKLVAAYN